MELLEYWYLFVRRKYIILLIFCISLVFSLSYLAITKPIYEADCTVLVKDVSKNNLLGDLPLGADMMESIGKSDPINTQMELIKRRPILFRVIEELNRTGNKVATAHMEQLQGGIVVQSIRNTNLITLKYRSIDSRTARDVVNILVNVFVEQNQRFNQEELTSAREFIEQQLIGQKEKVDAAENATLAYKRTSQTVSLSQETTAQLESLSKMEALKVELETRIKGASAQKKDLEMKLNDPNNQSNPFYAMWMKSLEEINNQVTNLNAQLGGITSDIARVNAGFNKLPPKEVQLARLMRDERLANEIYVRLLTKYDEVRINEASKVANIKIVEPAVLPSLPVWPNKKKVLLLSLILGLMLGFGVALILEYLEDKPRSLEELKKILPYTVLGQIPYKRNLSSLFMLTEPRSSLSESIRLMYSNLKFSAVFTKPNTSLMITSALDSEGKSVVMANLAVALGKMGKKVVLVDIDLRRPRLKHLFPQAKIAGVTDYLIGNISMKEMLHQDKESGISLISAGTLPPNPSELLSSAKMQSLVEKLRAEYDIVLFDSPPITMVSETLIFAGYVDGIMLLVDTMKTSVRAIRGMQDLLQDKHLPVIGVVYNKLVRENVMYDYHDYTYEQSADVS